MEISDIGEMTVFNSKEIPHETAENFDEGDEEGGAGAVLTGSWIEDVEKPAESQDWIRYDGGVVYLD